MTQNEEKEKMNKLKNINSAKYKQNNIKRAQAMHSYFKSRT